MAKYYIYNTEYDIVRRANNLQRVKEITGDSISEIKSKLDTKNFLEKSNLRVKSHKITKVFQDPEKIMTVGDHKRNGFTSLEKNNVIDRLYSKTK